VEVALKRSARVLGAGKGKSRRRRKESKKKKLEKIGKFLKKNTSPSI
jgi:hypothetical protein